MRHRLRLLTAASALGVFALAAGPAGREPGGVRAEAPHQAAELLEDPAVVILDIRTPPEVAQARIPGEVVNLDFHDPAFPQQLAELDRSTTYLMYCRSGQRSGNARTLMEQLGFEDVVDVRGGLIAWVDAGLEVHG